MKTILLFASTFGTTRNIIKKSLNKFDFKIDICDVKDLTNISSINKYELFIFFNPTTGDEEMHPEIERLLLNWELDANGQMFVICELGNYYGYDDFSFGSMRIIKKILLQKGLRQLCQPLSLDTIPRIPWEHYFEWVELVNFSYKNHVR